MPRTHAFGSGLTAAVSIVVFLTGCGAAPSQPVRPATTVVSAVTTQPSSTSTGDGTATTGTGRPSSESTRPGSTSAGTMAGQQTVPRPLTTTTRTTRSTVAPSKKPAATTKAPVPPVPSVTPPGKALVGYYPGWAAAGGYGPERIPVAQVTHIHYAFAKIDPATLRIVLAYPATDRANFAKLRALKQQNRHLTTRISIGGWDYSGYFSDAAATAQSRLAFARSCVAFIKEHGFDGVDIDWEYPVSGGLAGNHTRPQDKSNFTKLIESLRSELDRQGRADGRTYSLSFAAAANTGYLQKIELNKLVPLVDQVFLMAYDMHGPWDRYADLVAPLYTPSENSPQYKNSVDAAVSAYLSAGMPAKKLVLGMPFYGYRYTGVKGTGLYGSFSSASSISYDELSRDYLGNTQYMKNRHARALVPYLSGRGTFISYEDAASIADKVRYAKGKGLGGVGAWALSHDRSGVLLNSAYRALR